MSSINVILFEYFLNFLIVGPEEFDPNSELGQEERVLPYEKNTGLDDVLGHGQFVHDYLDFNRLDYELLLTSGASTLSKAMSLSKEDLESLIYECRNELTIEQVKARIEAIRVPDLELVCDGTYM